MIIKMSSCHMVFDIKMEDFHRKAHLVVGGHMTHVPNVIKHPSVVIRETMLILLLWQHYMT